MAIRERYHIFMRHVKPYGLLLGDFYWLPRLETRQGVGVLVGSRNVQKVRTQSVIMDTQQSRTQRYNTHSGQTHNNNSPGGYVRDRSTAYPIE